MSEFSDFVSSTVTAVPFLSRERFAAAVGVPVGVVVGWCNKGLVPTVLVGKYSLINVSLLQKQCLQKEFQL